MAELFLAAAWLTVAAFWGLAATRAWGTRVGVGVVAVLAGWPAAVCALAAVGAFPVYDDRPSPALLPLLAANVGALGLILSPLGARVAAAVPLSATIGFQVFRVPVELMLWRLAARGLCPQEMTFEGRNFDILTGVVALVVGAAWARREVPRAVAWGFTALGLALLANIVAIALLSFPGPLRVFAGPANLLPVTPPWVVLPVVLVPSALAGHALAIRQLRASGTFSSAQALPR